MAMVGRWWGGDRETLVVAEQSVKGCARSSDSDLQGWDSERRSSGC